MKIICIGRNYIDHAKELGNAVPEEPVFFLKPETALLLNNAPFYYPDFTKEIHYEVELIVKINRRGKYIPERFAQNYYSEIGLGIDFTARDIQRELKAKGLPWEKAKAFDHSAPVSSFFSLENFPGGINAIPFRLLKNGITVQTGNSKEMTFPVDKLIAHVSRFISLKIGDMIFTGTPAGVGEVAIGDKLEGFIGDRQVLTTEIK